MTWIHPLSAGTEQPADILGGKAHGLVTLLRLGLPVPPGFVIGTAACRAHLRDGRLPDGLATELRAAVARLEAATGRRLGGPGRPLVVSVRSGGGASMPGMMNTVLDLGLTPEATAALAAETGDQRFALDCRLRFLTGFDAATAPVPIPAPAPAGNEDLTGAIRAAEERIRERTGRPVPDDAMRQLEAAVAAVFASWDTPRARTYRELHGIPHELGTAVTVQAMVYGNRDRRSGSGVAFSRNPNTGAKAPFGEVLFGRQGDDVVSGRSITRPLADLAAREPAVWAALLDALGRVEAHYRDACHVEFTFEAGELWILQVRAGGLAGRAAVRVAVDLAGEGVIDRREALLRVSPDQVRSAGTPRLDAGGAGGAGGMGGLLVRGVGACPGVATGRLATTADLAVRMAADGPVILVRPETSPLDLPGLAAAAGVVTARGGPASHAAVVARSMGKPAVVGAAGLTVDEAAGRVRAGDRVVGEGTIISVDGTGGEVVLGPARLAAAAADPHLRRLLAWADEIAAAAPPQGSAATGDPAAKPGLARDAAGRVAAARAALMNAS
ncbi:MAG TPA: pyruvate, phosphate dikinase [Nonomuraea sp.]|nr:pyruvate, phosphate dikinase [Nonomuraea sp.]